MKLSRHTVFYDSPGSAGDCLVYNTRTQGVLKINKETRDFIGRITEDSNRRGPDVHRGPEYWATARVAPTSDEENACLNTLLDSGIIVDKETDEDKVLDHWFSEIKYRARPLHATILTTFKCNFACTYCFEENVKSAPHLSSPQGGEGRVRGETMDDATADQVIAYLKHKAEEKKSPKIRLMFYGGEPLMNPGAVIKIATELQQWTKERGIKFSFGMITNGSLVKPDIIEQLTPLGLTSIRITLDGDKEVHDRRRPFLDGRGSFDTIIRNIEDVLGVHPSVIARSEATKQSHCCEIATSRLGGTRNDNAPAQVKVELGGNFDQHNIAGLHRLLDYLEQKGLNKRIARVLFAPVVSRLGGDENLTVEPVGCHKLSGELAEQGIKLERELIQRGYKTPSSVKVSACPMTMDDSMLVIDPSGDIYKCEAFVGRQQFCIGNVRTAKFNHRYYEFITMKPWQAQECLECPYVPMCGGGCRYIAQLKHGDYTKPACDKEYYEKIFPQLLKMDYERGVL